MDESSKSPPGSTADTLLPILYQEIEHRCDAVATAGDPWPCGRGCDSCCRNLGEPMRLVRAEWQQLENGLGGLDAEVRADVERRLDAVADQQEGPVVCPFLDLDQGACRVYEYRPAACRTYGYYQSRDGGRHCELVTAHVAEPDQESAWDSGVVWGSQEAVDRRLDRELGPRISLRRWWSGESVA